MKNLGFLLKYSLRNLKRNPKRTAIIFITLAISTTFAIWSFNVNESGIGESVNEITGHYVGKYQIGHKEFDLFSSEIKMHRYLRGDFELAQSPLVTPRVLSPVFISGEKKTVGALMVGVDPARERSLTTFYKSIAEGNYLLDDSVSNPIVLGGKLANRLNVKLNDEVVVLGQGLDGSVANDLFKVVGIYSLGGGDLEDRLMFTNIKKLREFITMPEDGYHLLVGMNPTAYEKIDQNKVNIMPWEKLIPDVSISLLFMMKLNFVLTLIMVFVISLGVSNTLFVSFNERQKEIQSLNVIGANSTWITLSLMIETFSMLILAVITGSILATVISNYFFYHPIDLRLFTGGKEVMIGGMKINAMVKVNNLLYSHIISISMISVFVALSMIYPIARVLKRSKRVS